MKKLFLLLFVLGSNFALLNCADPNELDTDGMSPLAHLFQDTPKDAISQAKSLLQGGAILFPLVSKARLVKKGLTSLDYLATPESVFLELQTWWANGTASEKKLVTWYLGQVMLKHYKYDDFGNLLRKVGYLKAIKAAQANPYVPYKPTSAGSGATTSGH